MSKRLWEIFFVLFLSIALSGCSLNPVSNEDPTSPEALLGAGQKAGMANPAAIKCIEDGGSLEKTVSEAGEDADCVFGDGTRCAQWDYFNGKCGISETEKVEYMGDLISVDGSNASGTVYVSKNGDYYLKAKLNNLADLEDGYFYEGWVVRQSPLSVISTGKVELINGEWVNEWTSSEDLTDHSQYVLTLEPDDGDPAPAGHVLEGEMERI